MNITQEIKDHEAIRASYNLTDISTAKSIDIVGGRGGWQAFAHYSDGRSFRIVGIRDTQRQVRDDVKLWAAKNGRTANGKLAIRVTVNAFE